MLRASLFKTLHVRTGDDQPIDLGAPTTRALFAYLLLHRNQPVDRRYLAFQLWPRGTETAARRNLRQYIHRIRRAIEEVGLDVDVLLSEGSTLQINPSLPFWLDIDAFRQGTRPGATFDELKQSVDLYTGDLLEDVYEDWCNEARESLRQRYLQALANLSVAARNAGQLDEAIQYTQKRLQNDPFDEDAHREIMRLFALNGDRARAIQHYQALRQLLEEELDAEPLPETQSLLAAIQKGGLPQTGEPISGNLPPASSFSVNEEERSPAFSPPAPPLVGREAELNMLRSASEMALQGSGQFVLITGESGIGKTRLIREYLEMNPGKIVMQGACHELEARTPYAPLRVSIERSLHLLPKSDQAIPPWLSTLAALVPALTQRYPFLPHAEAGSNDHARITDAFAGLLSTLSAQHPETTLHLILDNLHWADNSTWEVLAFLARRAAAFPILIIGLCRVEDLSQEQAHVIRTLQRNKLIVQTPLGRLNEA